VPISAFGGLSDDKATRADLEGWRQHTSAAFALAMVPGNHFFLQQAPSRAPVLLAVARALAAA
jgi:medium-chain acyl-[acyl-carrier-protein] hydrolase